MSELINADGSPLSQRKPFHTTSDKYTFIPTHDIIRDFDSLGWKVEDTKYGKPRSRERIGFQKHMVIFGEKTPSFTKNDVSPRIVVVNSHDGSSAFRFNAGLIRWVCENGLIVSDQTFGDVSIRHINYTYAELKRVMEEFMQRIPTMHNTVEKFMSTKMTTENNRQFAWEAGVVRFGEEKMSRVKIDDILTPRRTQDNVETVWNTMNVIQENLIRGGVTIEGIKKSSKPRKTREVRSVAMNVEVNKAVWQLATQYSNN